MKSRWGKFFLYISSVLSSLILVACFIMALCLKDSKSIIELERDIGFLALLAERILLLGVFLFVSAEILHSKKRKEH